jgi:hypothetical protein
MLKKDLAAAYYHYGNVEALERKTINVALHKAPPIPGKYGGLMHSVLPKNLVLNISLLPLHYAGLWSIWRFQ